MKILIIGIGKVGRTLARTLVKEGCEVVIVDNDQKKIEEFVNEYDAKGVVGNGLERQVLLDADATDADLVISCTSKDEVNILCSVLAKKLGAKKTTARIRDPQYFNEVNNMLDLGLDYAFNPEYRASKDIASLLKFPSAKSIESFAHGKALMVEFDIKAGNTLIGKSLMDISKEMEQKLLFGMIERNNEVLIPRGDFVIEENDTVFIIATESELTAFSKKINIFTPRAKSAFIVGGGKIAYYLTKEISDWCSVKILEKDINRCEELAMLLPQATILNGDGTDQKILVDEGMKNSDAFISLTGMDEENVIVSLYAMGEKVDKVITKVDRDSIKDIGIKLGLHSIVCPRMCIANYLISFVRSLQNYGDDEIKVFYKLNNKIEAVEFLVGENFEGIGVPLSELKIRKQVLIGGIVRNGEYIFPDGNTVINKGDRVIVVTAVKQIAELGDILK
ncbi:MAG: Trk system potassium transporter TrkA [Clostridia bacterium]|nr:Trk system potassium transporter TrkA [Clostridia bacterium]